MTKSGVLSFVKHPHRFCVVAIVVVLAGTAGAQIKVDAPTNNSVVNSPFYLQAKAPTCDSSSTTGMTYSIDSENDAPVQHVQALQAMVTIPVNGVHTLHVKAWSSGGMCEQNVLLTVGDGVNISAPAQNAIVTSPFVLEAQAPTCDGQSTSSMAYSLDSGSDTLVQGSQSLNVTNTGSAGSHILRVKAWGTSGAYCESDVNLTVAGSSGLVPGAGASHVDHLENNATYTGGYIPNCPGGADGKTSTTNKWLTEADCGTGGTKSGSTTPVSTSVYGSDSNSRKFTMTYSQSTLDSRAGVRWSDKAIASESSATHFQYDAYVYFPTASDVSNLANLELDINHVANLSGTNQLYILGVQCNLTEGLWQVTAEGAPGTWVDTNAACSESQQTPAQVTPGVWHHFQIQTHQNASTIYYDAVAIDGNVTPITACKIASGSSKGQSISCDSTPKNSTWGPQIGPNFQMDGYGTTPNSTITAYVDDFTIFYW